MELKKRVTLKDLAGKTGFTINTVSRALQDSKDISDKTKRIIFQAASSMGYVRDSTASAMRSGRTDTLAVIIGDIANPFFGTLVRDIELNAKKAGFTVIIYNTGENSGQEREAILSAYSKKVEGIIICPVQESRDNVILLQRLHVPFVLVARYFDDIETDTVHWNDVKSGELAAGYLLDQGHTNVLFIGGPLYITSSRDRLEGYRNAFASRGVAVKEELVKIVSVQEGEAGEAVIQAINEGLPFTAVTAFSDLMAYEVLYAIRNRLPHVQVTGCDNIQEKLRIPLNFPSVGSDEDEAKLCVELLMEKIQNKGSRKAVSHVLDVTLKLP